MPGHALSGKHAPRILRHAGRAGLVVRDRVAVACAVGREVVALDHPGEALALRDAGYVYDLAHLEYVDPDLAAELEIRELAFRDAEFAQHVPRLHRRLG